MERPHIHEPSGFVAGVWANDFDIFWSPHEFTLDFVRLEARGSGAAERGAAVARVAMTPALMLQLRDKIDDVLEEYQTWTSHPDLQ